MPEGMDVKAGMRKGLPLVLPTFALGISFGVLAQPVMGSVAPIVMSVLVFSGAAQFGATAVLAAGGDAAAAIVAGTLLNARFLPMGVALAPSVTGGVTRRAVEGQAVVDASWALAARGGGLLDRDVMLGATIPQYPGWVLGTVIGVFAGQGIGDPDALGLDAIFPAFFLALVAPELSSPWARAAAIGGGGIALLLAPVVPAGLPVLAASAAALIGAWKR
jgi:predicted branched-subunit amino acid permease